MVISSRRVARNDIGRRVRDFEVTGSTRYRHIIDITRRRTIPHAIRKRALVIIFIFLLSTRLVIVTVNILAVLVELLFVTLASMLGIMTH